MLFLVDAVSQVPNSFSYQAVVRDSDGELLKNVQLGMRISILQNGVDGTVMYEEIHTPTSNDNGLVTLEIGEGTAESGDFSSIDWSAGPYFIKVEIDPTGGTSYTITGTSQLLSVPYALYANKADSVTGTDIGDILSNGNDGDGIQIKNIADPTDDQDVVTLSYVKSFERRLFELEFNLGKDSVADCEGNYYHIVKIGDQYWFKENLKTKHFSNCDTIPDGRYQDDLGPYWFVYNDDMSNANTYGLLYTQGVALDERNICPPGWHVSTSEDWTELEEYLGGSDVAGGKLKEAGTLHWSSPNTGATNETGFTALPGGIKRLNSGEY